MCGELKMATCCGLAMEVRHSWTLLIKMVEVTLIDFSYLNRLVLLTFTELGPQFSNQDFTDLSFVPQEHTLSSRNKMSNIWYPQKAQRVLLLTHDSVVL